MFPINFNFPYRKKDGSLITMEKALDGAGADLDLIDLDDVEIESPTTGEVLQYNGTSEKWENKPIEVDDLGDVDITTPATGDVLVYNGTSEKWENKPIEVDDLGDVDITTPATGDVLVYNGTSEKWENKHRFFKVAEAEANQTWAAQLTTLLSAFNSLSAQDKARAFISASDEYGGDGLYRLAGRNVATFSLLSVGGTGVVNIVALRLSNSTAQNVQIATNGTITSSDISSTTNTLKLLLCLD